MSQRTQITIRVCAYLRHGVGLLATCCPGLMLDRAHRDQIIVKDGPHVTGHKSYDSLSLARDANELHLEPFSVVHFDDGTKVALAQSVPSAGRCPQPNSCSCSCS